jgi:enoyl-CoA hydratase
MSAAPVYETLKVERPEPHILVLTLNRPQAMNAMSTQLGLELRAFLRDFDHFQSPEVRCVIFTGAGDKALCVGADLKERQGMTDETWRKQHVIFEEAADALWRFPVPVICAANGYALGGGCEMALCCDFILASDKASFGLPEVTRGIIPGTGGTQRLPRRIGPGRAKELLFTGRILTAAQAEAWGLVNRVVPAERLMAEALETARAISKNGPIAVRQAKKSVERGAHMALDVALAWELECYAQTVPTDDRREGINAFNEKRPAAFKNR